MDDIEFKDRLVPSFKVTDEQRAIVVAYRSNPAMRPSIRKLLGISAPASAEPKHACRAKIIDITKFIK